MTVPSDDTALFEVDLIIIEVIWKSMVSIVVDITELVTVDVEDVEVLVVVVAELGELLGRLAGVVVVAEIEED